MSEGEKAPSRLYKRQRMLACASLATCNAPFASDLASGCSTLSIIRKAFYVVTRFLQYAFSGIYCMLYTADCRT